MTKTKFVKENYKRIKIKGKTVNFDDNLHHNLQEVKDMINLKFDGVVLFDGMEGSGKSELAMQTCLVMDKSFSDADVFYSVEQFEEWLDNAKPGKAGCWDEFVLAGLSTDALTKLQGIIIKKFTMIRKKALYIALVIPYIFMLRKYFAVARTRCLVHVYAIGKQRGYFRFYTYSQKTWIFNYGHKTWLYSDKVIPAFQGKFEAWSLDFLDDDKIQAKKDEALRTLGDEDNSIKLTPKVIEYMVIGNCLNNTFDRVEQKKEYNLINKLQVKLSQMPLPNNI